MIDTARFRQFCQVGHDLYLAGLVVSLCALHAVELAERLLDAHFAVAARHVRYLKYFSSQRCSPFWIILVL